MENLEVIQDSSKLDQSYIDFLYQLTEKENDLEETSSINTELEEETEMEQKIEGMTREEGKINNFAFIFFFQPKKRKLQ